MNNPLFSASSLRRGYDRQAGPATSSFNGLLSDAQRIVYTAAPGAKVVIKGSEPVKGWTRVQNDTWKVTLPNTFFGNFNPYADLIRGTSDGSRPSMKFQIK